MRRSLPPLTNLARRGGVQALLLAVAMTLCSGCESGRQWFQMSSDSPMPFFGFDLLPRRSSTRSISAGSDDELTIQTADARDGDRSSFEARILPTREAVTPQITTEEPSSLPRISIELPELRKAPINSENSASPDDFGEPFPEPLELSTTSL